MFQPSLFRARLHFCAGVLTAIALVATNRLPAQSPGQRETPDQWVSRLEGKYASNVDEATEREYQQERAAFLRQFPNAPARWRLKILDAERALHGAPSRDPGDKQVRAGLVELLAARDAPAALREQASLDNFRFELKSGSRGTITKAATDHLAMFPKSKYGSAIANAVVGAYTNGLTEEKAIASLQALAGNSPPALAQAAAQKAKQLEVLIDLKHNPMELKFTTTDGRPLDLTQYRGKYVLIDFWATWCGPCVAALPEVIDLYKKYHGQGFEIVGISFDNEKESLAKFLGEHDMPWEQYFDGKGWGNEIGQKYGIESIPRMWLVGPDGRVLDFNARSGLSEKIAKAMNDSSSGQSVAGSNGRKKPTLTSAGK